MRARDKMAILSRQNMSRLSPSAPHTPLAIVSRGDATESVHYGSVAVVDGEGRLLFSAGDSEFLTTTRSALKPLQALPFVAGGGVEHFGFSPRQVALMCASHSGEPRHDEAPGAGAKFSTLHHNCSGKHSGMLAYCRQCGLPFDEYVAFDHPLQQAIRTAVAHLTGVAESDLVAGVDGCSAPNYAVPLSRLAFAYARLAGEREDVRYGTAPSRLPAGLRGPPGKGFG